jgi:hypothetical protein
MLVCMTNQNSGAPSQFEKSPEQILSRESVLSKLREYCDAFVVERELSDPTGVYLLEVVSADGKKMYTYQRAGEFPGSTRPISSSSTVVRVDDLDGSFFSETLADYNPATGVWTKNE